MYIVQLEIHPSGERDRGVTLACHAVSRCHADLSRCVTVFGLSRSVTVGVVWSDRTLSDLRLHDALPASYLFNLSLERVYVCTAERAGGRTLWVTLACHALSR